MDKAKLLQLEMKKIFGDAPVNLVGGSVRDILLDKEPKDWDYNTPLTPDEIEACVRKAGRRPYLTGKRFGTIGFKVPTPVLEEISIMPDGNSEVSTKTEFVYVEVTTYRTETYDGKSRKPEVAFISNLDEDLARRDFTINAIVLDAEGELYDPNSGVMDILARHIKSVGMPKDRIKEDPLRILRAARFAAQLRFGVDTNFIGKAKQLSSTIVNVSKERWVQELDKLLIADEPMRGIKVLMQTEVAKYIFPEVYLSLLDDEVYGLMAESFEKNKGAPLDEKWAILFNYVAYPYVFTVKDDKVLLPNNEEVRKEILLGTTARLKFSKDRTNNLTKNKEIFNKSIDF